MCVNFRASLGALFSWYYQRMIASLFAIGFIQAAVWIAVSLGLHYFDAHGVVTGWIVSMGVIFFAFGLIDLLITAQG